MLSYLPILIFLLVGVGFAIVTIWLSTVIIPRHTSPAKEMPYESGANPIGSAHSRFEIKFYLVAVLFILFDIEVVFLYPWAVAFRHLGLFALIEMVLFIVILFVGYAYLIKKKALEWN